MKKLFNHRKRPYDDKINYDDWDEIDQFEEEEFEPIEEFDSLEEADEIPAEEDFEPQAADSVEEYETEAYEEEYETEAYEEEYLSEYDDEEYDTEYDGEYAEEYGDDDEYYNDDENYDDDEYYDDDENYDDDEYYDDDEPLLLFPHKGTQPRKKARGGLLRGFLNMGLMDKIITCTGVTVLIVALVTGSIYASSRIVDNQIESFVSVGTQLADIDLPGEVGLLAVADAEAWKRKRKKRTRNMMKRNMPMLLRQ